MGSKTAEAITVAATYNAAADHFDDKPLSFWDRYGRLTVERLRLPNGAVVLDVGCGAGASALPAAQSVGDSGRVIGVDLAESLLARARAKANALSLTNVELLCADMTALDFPEASFDAVISVFSIFFVPDMVALTGSLWRMLRSGGRLAITTWGPRAWEPGSSIWWAAVQRVRPDLVPSINPWERVIDPQAVSKLMFDAGIEFTQVVPVAGQQELAGPHDWWSIVLGSGYRWTVEQMRPDEREQVRTDCLDAFKQREIKAIETNVIFAEATKAKGAN